MARFHIRNLLAGCATIMVPLTAHAGGFDRGGVGIDLLFDEGRVATEAGVTYVSPQRTLKNVRRQDAPPFPVALSSSSVEVEGDYAVPRLGVKVNVFEPVDCLGTYTEPYGADARYGEGNAYSVTSTEFKVDTRDFGLTCSYRIPLGKGAARIIGGVSYQEVDALQARESLLAVGNTGVGEFKLSDEAWSWRLGAAYEIPEIAFRASVLYSARYEYNLGGTVDSTDFAGMPLGNAPGVFPVTASTEIPQAVEIKVQSGIAPGWLAFGSIRWQEWSKLQSIPINGVIRITTGEPSTTTSFDPFYQDGWTVTGGVGHKFSDRFSGVTAITWDRGTSTISGYQSDTWNFSAGGSFTPSQNVEMRLGGSVGLLTSGSSRPAGTDTANLVSYEYGNDVVYAGSASLKVKF